MSWVEQPLEMIAKCELGKMLDKNKNKGEYEIYLSNVDVRWGYFEMDELKKMRFETREFERYSLNTGDIIMCEGGEAGRCAIWKNAKIKMMYQKALHRIRTKKNIDSGFLFYQFLNMGNNGKFEAYYTGATIKHLPLQILKKIPISIAPLQTQKRIADILSAYDDLIENNLKRIKLLEQAAQNIYKEWFVNMRFPDYKNIPINEETGLPEGWEVCTINDVCQKIASGGTPSRRNKSYWDNPKYPWVTTKELRDGFILDVKESVSEEGLKNSSAKLFPKGTVLMAIYASPTLGRLGILSKEACCNQAAVGFICDNTKITNQFLYYALYAERANLNAIAIGAAQQNINVGKVKAHEIILPTFHFVKNFTSITSSNYEMRLNLVTQNQKLKAARDILLPRLMNRTIEV
jgi:type I restriction enzyme S subunit